MVRFSSRSIAATAIGFASITCAAVTSCPSSGVCYSLSIPDTTASSGNGDIYFQLSGPTTYEYIALGQGSRMSGSNMFVMYTSSSTNNVTISPRLGVGYSQPQHDNSAYIHLLAGSGVSNGIMTANVRCSNCHSWNGGSMDFSSSSASWIYAVAPGSSLGTSNLNAGISMHSSAASFTFDLAQARGGSATANPFGSSPNITGTSGIPATCTPISNTFQTSSPESGSDSKAKRAGSCPPGYAPSTSTTSSASGGSSPWSTMVLAHGVLASLAFVALFPIGGILIRIANFTGLIWVHAALQILAVVIYAGAAGLGVYLAMQVRLLSNAHSLIGLVLLIVVVVQPITGWLHHKLFKKYHDRSLWSYIHLWGGRGAIVLGMVNGGLGLALVETGRSVIIAYGIVAGVVGLTYFAVILFANVRKTNRSTASKHDKHQQGHQLERLSGSGENVRRQTPRGGV